MKRGKGPGKHESCRRCAGSGCRYCGMSGLETNRLALMSSVEHPAVTELDLAAHQWAAEQGTTEAQRFARAVVLFAATVNDALTGES
jgi:hypothetical protein